MGGCPTNLIIWLWARQLPPLRFYYAPQQLFVKIDLALRVGIGRGPIYLLHVSIDLILYVVRMLLPIISV